MNKRFVLSRANKAALKARVIELTLAYNDLVIENHFTIICDEFVTVTLDQDMKAGMTVRARVPKKYTVRNY